MPKLITEKGRQLFVKNASWYLKLTEDGGVACLCVEIWLLSGLISQPNQRESVSYSIVFHRSGAKRQQMMSMQTFSSSSN